MKVGVCGTGRMGAPISWRLIDCGHAVTVWNRDTAKTRPLVAAGATSCASPADLADKVDVIVVMLLNDAAVKAVYQGENGLLSTKLTKKLVIDMSTVRPDTMIAMGQAVVKQGGTFVECPVGGSTAPAREGKLFGLVGGSKADVAQAMPILEQLCRRIEHVGEVGAGATMKLAINLPLLVYWQALGESLAICKNLGLSGAKLIDILSDTAGAPTAMKGRGAVIAKALDGGGPGDTNFAVSAAKKDLATAVQFAKGIGASLPLAAAAVGCYEEAEAAGLANADATAIPVRWSRRIDANAKQ